MITQSINLNLIPGAVPPRVNVTQYDEGSRTIVANLYNGTSSFTPSAGTTAKVKGTKPDKHGFEYDATISGSTVEIDLTQQMSCVAGDVPCEVELTLGDEVLGTGTFVLRVKASALADDTDISETELPDIIDAARSSAASAAASAEAAQEAANSVSVEYTVSGNPISVSAFPTEATTSMTIAPTQNLHGYDKPWAGGAGKNKLPLNQADSVTHNSVEYTKIYDDAGNAIGVNVDGTASPNLSYCVLYGDGTNGNTLNGYTTTVIPAGTSIYCGDTGSGVGLHFRYTDGTYENNVQTQTITLTKDVGAVYLQVNANTTVSDRDVRPFICLSSESDHTFAPYTNICPITGITTATVQTTDGETTNTASMELGETVFGGSVDFNAGTGSKTYVSTSITSTSGISFGVVTDGYGKFSLDLSDATALTVDNILCDKLPTISRSQYITPTQDGLAVGVSGSTPNRIGLCIYGVETLDALATWLTNNPLQVVYKLATPTTLSLTAATLTMLNGEQTVSGNGETVTLIYDGNVKQYIDTKVPDAPTTDGTYTLTCVVSGGVPTYSWT